MKKTVLVLILAIFLMICASACADQDTSINTRLLQTTSGRGNEYVAELSEGWKFGGKGVDASAEDYDDSLWTTINLPHTWNITDAGDGDGNYDRTLYWYRKTVVFASVPEGKRVYLEFLGANQSTNLYLNGEHIPLCGSEEYTHKGGYTAFRYDITEALRNGVNTFAVSVDNRYSEEIAPISADFNMYGGIYRRLYLITLDDVHVDVSKSGSSGLFLTTPNIRSLKKPDDFGKLNIRADIANDGNTDRKVTVTAHIEGDNAPADIVRSITVPAGGSVPFDENIFVRDPHLWKGIDYSGSTDNSDVGYQYTVTLTISEGEKTIDSVSDRVGFRYFYVDPEKGFFLNGEPHPLRGVNRHQFADGMGNALKEMNHEEDIELIKELGANTIRLCHYPHTDYFYDLCDENGIIVWTEIPLVNAVGTKESFMDVTKTQLTELIRQQYNHPSICFWGLENEIGDNTRNSFYTAKELLSELDRLAHEEDPSGRYTTQAVNRDMSMDENDPAKLADDHADIGWKSDLIGWNVYPGWYSSFVGTFQELVDNKTSRDSRPMALSEYGWGASVTQHELYPELGKHDLLPTGKWHPEEYQNLMHEQAVAYINAHDNLWATFIWAMFDFDVDTRNEGSRAAQNDKGLMTNDRSIKKDSYYLYKANWDRREPFAHITSSRFTPRPDISTYVKVYSNCDSVDLYWNGALVGPMTSMGNGIFLYDNIDLVIGENKMLAIGKMGDETCEDTCIWSRAALTTTNLVSDVLQVDASAATVLLPHPMTLGELREILKTADHATYKVTMDSEEITNEAAPVHSRMKIVVSSESASKSREYRFVADAMTVNNVTATSSEKGNGPENVLSSGKKTRWTAANNSYPQSITIDLGKSCYLKKLTVDWYDKGGRYYAYSVEISEDGENYVLAADCSGNKQPNRTVDQLYMEKGRFVRINILSCSNPSGYAGLYSISLQTGQFLSSEEYLVDRNNMLILVPALDGLTAQELSSRLTAEDNAAFFILSETEDIAEGTQVLLVDVFGEVSAYTVTTEKNAHRYLSDIALNKRVYFSSEEGESGSGQDTHAANINDGLKDTAWVADTKVKGVPGKKADYPEWICVDLGKNYYIHAIELSFEQKKERIYQYQIFSSPDMNWHEDAIPQLDYRLIVDQSNNMTFDHGQYRLELKEQEARYIVVMVLGNSLYPENKYAAAGIYDLKVYGTSYSADD